MKAMKTILALGAALALAGAANAASVNVTLIGGNNHDPDGAGFGRGNTHTGYFQMSVTNVSGIAANNLGGDISVGASFRTFCIEIGETLANGAHSFNVNTQSIQGGASPFNPQPLVAQTAFLYSTFRAGNAGTIVAGWNDGSNAHLNALQDAIWFFQNQLGLEDVDDNAGVTLSANAQLFVDAANAAVSGGSWVGIGNVRVLNMGANSVSQDVLALVPLPQGAGLAGAAMLIAGIRRRRSL